MEISKEKENGQLESELNIYISNKPSVSVMKINDASLKNPSHWKSIRMRRVKVDRRMNSPDTKNRSGAGSTFGQAQRQERWKQKVDKKWAEEERLAPWLLKINDNDGKSAMLKAGRDGTAAQHSCFYILEKEEGSKDVVLRKADEWYHTIQYKRFKAMKSDEVEKHWERRNEILNHFSLMLKKKLNRADGHDSEEEGSEPQDKKNEENDDEDEEEDTCNKNQSKKRANLKRLKGMNAILYGSDSDEDQFNLSDSDSSSDASNINDKRSRGKKEEDHQIEDMEDEISSESDNDNKDISPSQDTVSSMGNNSSVEDTFSDDEVPLPEVAGPAPTALKRERKEEPSTSCKHSKGSKKTMASDPDVARSSNVAKSVSKLPDLLKKAASEGLSEENMIRYLRRKPMSMADLLRKFKTPSLNNDDKGVILVHLLRAVNPFYDNINNKLYFSLSPVKYK